MVNAPREVGVISRAAMRGTDYPTDTEFTLPLEYHPDDTLVENISGHQRLRSPVSSLSIAVYLGESAESLSAIVLQR